MDYKDLKKYENLVLISDQLLKNSSNLTNKDINTSLYRWSTDNKVIRIKKGLYITRENYDKYKNNPNFFEYIASIIRFPSYISSATVLRKYNVLTEVTYGIYSVTTKTSRIYKPTFSSYIYKHVHEKLFSGYETANFMEQEYLIATKEKALFDYIYEKARSMHMPAKEDNIVEELRLNLDVYSTSDLQKLIKWSELINNSKLFNIIMNIIHHAPNNI